MRNVFLSYARRDGAAAATELRRDLTEMGLFVWRDIEEMRGGLDWRAQIRDALAAVDAVLVLLTPGAVESGTVTWEWQTALDIGRRVIPLLIQPCDPPPSLAALHYHDFTKPDAGRTALNRLVRDLIDAPSLDPVEATTADTYAVREVVGGVVGSSGVVVNENTTATIDPESAPGLPQEKATFRVGRATDSVIGPDGRVENRRTHVSSDA